MSRKKVNPPDGELNFEEGLARLEEIMESLESGQLSLDDSIARFEEGAELYRLLSVRLESVEGKVRRVLEDFEKKTTEVPRELEGQSHEG